LKVNDVYIEILDDVSEGEYLDALKCGEEPPIRYKILVKKDNELVARYIKEFKTRPNVSYFNNFIKKFLRDPSYRVQFQSGTNGWDEVIEWDYPVKPSTREAISKLNNTPMNKLRFKDFARLKVGGFDKFSKMKMDKLDSIISAEDKILIENELTDENLILQAKRWVARGLEVRKSIRKVKTDQTIKNNIRK
ncbi:MAG: hypothetical protein ACTSRP_27395, partial [Candidatus Helarchaeota archaeon]